MKLLVDSMLGTLGKWLRLLGYDAAIAVNHASDAELARQARAEGRVLLTRDRGLAGRRGLQTLLVEEGDLDAQLLQVMQALCLPAPQPGSRCVHCNALLQPASHEEVAHDVPPYVLQTQPAFRRCPRCRRVYWRGTHMEQIEQKAKLWRRAQGRAASQ
ncbi:MAG: Mut7-C RNAse domain-containing protein [Caldilineales bacterium]|nr:Mut7-C RNAse domain-containing protein [Caldilineales bacterium]MDW8318675.1 Mut7-C RNAse domain-containing protein [Anaerolineae bacterium]